MTASADVLVQVNEGGRALVQTADSVLRQRVKPASIALIKPDTGHEPPLLRSVASRLGAMVVDGSQYPGLALNAALRNGTGSFFIVVPAGFRLHETFVERCEIEFQDESIGAIAPTIAFRAPDGTGQRVSVPAVSSNVALLSDVGSGPPVFALRPRVWNALNGFDEALSSLVTYEFWVRLLCEGVSVRVLQSPLVTHDLDGEALDNAGDQMIESFRAVLERNRSVLDARMSELLVASEIRFGQLRTKHRALLAERDQELAELDRLRAATEHHRAYLQHHGHDEFDWGDFRRTDPVSRDWGYDRGMPVDRRHIDDFLSAHSSDVRGNVLEVQEDDFTLAYGGRRALHHDILDISSQNQRATILADLRFAPEISSDTYDCIILTQTLHVIDDVRAALRECHRILKPGGVLLATFPAASRVCLEYGEEGDYWRMTAAGARALLQSSFEPAITSCQSYGNVLTNTAFLHGLGAAEITDAEFDVHDPYFPALIGVRAKKKSARGRIGSRGVVLLYHRVDGTPDVHGLGVPPDVFELQLQWLRANSCLLPLDDVLSAPAEELPERAVAMTFDDGYEDNLQIAAPLLQRHGAPATFFLTSAGLEAPIEYWWDTVERLLLKATTPALLDMSRAGINLHVPTSTMDERLVAHWQLHERLVHASLEQRNRAIEYLHHWAGTGTPRVRPMVAEEVWQLAQLPGMTIGAHTVNHLALPDIGDSLAEINECQASLRRVSGQPVEVFAYPYGAVDRQTAATVRRSWRWGLSCDERVLGDSFDAARVPRLDVKAWTQQEFASRVSRLF